MGYADDLNKSQEAFAPLPSGPYFAEVMQARHKMTSNGKPMFEVCFKVLVGPQAGRTVWRNFVVSRENPAAMARFFGDLNVLGADRTFFMADPTDAEVADKLLASRARVQIEVNQREWNGSMRNDISKVSHLPVGVELPSNSSVPSAAPSVPSVSPAPFVPAVATAAPSAAPTAPVVAPAPATPVADDEVPF